MICEYCNNTFSSKTNLQKHQKYTKYCLKLQGKEEEEYKFKCSGCGKNYTSGQNLEVHERKCKQLQSKNQEQKHEEKINNYKTKLKDMENMYKQKLKDMEDDYKKKLLFQSERHRLRIESIYDSHQNELKRLKEKEKEHKEREDKNGEQIKDLQNKLENIALKSVSKSTTTNNNNNNKTQIINNYIQNLKPLTKEHLAECSKHLTLEHIKKGASGYAEYALNHPFKNTILCVDYSRRKIKMKNKDDEVISDPEMSTSSKMFFGSIFSRNKELLQEYSKEKKDVENKHGQDYANEMMFNLARYIGDVARGKDGEHSDLQRYFVKEVCSKKAL